MVRTADDGLSVDGKSDAMIYFPSCCFNDGIYTTGVINIITWLNIFDIPFALRRIDLRAGRKTLIQHEQRLVIGGEIQQFIEAIFIADKLVIRDVDFEGSLRRWPLRPLARA